jgi:perosamine synthetase
VEAKLTRRTRAAITADNHTTEALLAQAGVPVVEDACQAHGTRVQGHYAGTRATAGCFSTHDRKLLATGEGGFVLTNDEGLADRIDHYTHLGHLRGDTHGVNYKLAGPLAAIGLRRLRHLGDQLRHRRANADRLLDAVTPGGMLRELKYGPDDTPNYYNLVLVADRETRIVAADLAAAGLPPDSVRYGYRPLYHQPMFSAFTATCRNAERLATTTFQLPVHPAMSETALQWVAEQLATINTGEAR